MTYMASIHTPTVMELINAMLLLPPHVRRYSISSNPGVALSQANHCILVIDDAAEKVEVIFCKQKVHHSISE